jgi:hypothetical protein
MHGLAAHALFARDVTDWVLHSVIMLELIRLRPRGSD